jgi:hypothetical protein
VHARRCATPHEATSRCVAKRNAIRSGVAQTEPWISFHAPWTERSKTGLVIFERIQRFLAACAVDPAPDVVELTAYTAEIAADATAAFGPPREARLSADGTRGIWRFEQRAPVDAAPFVAFYRERESLPPPEHAPSRRALGLMINHWFEVKRPGTTAPLFPDSQLQSSVMIWLDSRAANLSIRYDSPELTPALRAAHADIVAALGPKTPRHALQRIIPARTLRGRERREPLT